MSFMESLKRMFMMKKEEPKEPEVLKVTILFHLTLKFVKQSILSTESGECTISARIAFKERGSKRILEVIDDNGPHYGCPSFYLLHKKCNITMEIFELWEKSTLDLEKILNRYVEFEGITIEKLEEELYAINIGLI